MQLKPEEISKVIRSQIKYYENAIQQNETGTILMVGDGIARASGLVNCMAGELLDLKTGQFRNGAEPGRKQRFYRNIWLR